MSGAPLRRQPPACAAHGFGQALRAGDAHEKSARPTPRRASPPGLCARVPPAQGSSQALTRNHNDNKPRPPRPSRDAGSHSFLVAPPRIARRPPVRPPRGSPFQCHGARSFLACVTVARRLRRKQPQRKGAVWHAVQGVKALPCTAAASVSCPSPSRPSPAGAARP